MRRRSIQSRVFPVVTGVLFLLSIGGYKANQVHGSSTSPSYLQILTPHCTVNWTEGYADATGIGFPSQKSVNARHAKEMTRRAAMGVAFRNLLECLRGVKVDSTTTIKNYMAENDEIRVKVAGMVQGAKVIKEIPLSDGSYEVTVRMNVTGGLSHAILPKQGSRPAKKISGEAIQTKGVKNKYTGLVVDARGTGVEPSLSPRIVTEDGQEAYSIAYVKKQDLIDQGIAVYVPTLPSAKNHERVTNNPLEVTAIGATGKHQKTDIVIRNVDAQTLHVVPEHFEFLEKAKVLIILDHQDP